MALSNPSVLDTTSAGAGAGNITSGSISPTANALLVLSFVCIRTGSAEPTFDITSITDTLTGTGSWNWLVEPRAAGGETIAAAVAWAIAGSSPGSGAITVNISHNAAARILVTSEVTGHDTTAPVAQSAGNNGAGSTLTVTLSSSPAADSIVFAVINDDQTGGGAITAGSGFTELTEVNQGRSNLEAEYDNGGGDTTADWSTLNSLNNAGVAIEIAAATSSSVFASFVGAGLIGQVLSPREAFSKPSYEIWLTTDTGNRIAQLTTFNTFEASRIVNQIGSFNMTMPLSFNPNLIQPDRMVQFWRQPRGGRLKLWRVYFIRKWKFRTSQGVRSFEFGGPDVLDLLRRRIVAAFAGSSQATATAEEADDLMKRIVTESIADGVAPTPDAGTRVWDNLSIAADLTLGPAITRTFSFKKLLTTSGQGTLPIVARAAKEAGTEVFFDIVPDTITGSSASYIFQTYTGQPGADLTDRMVFDEARGNMDDIEYEEDWTEEENYIYAAGQNQEADRNVQQVYDADRYNISIWGRGEGQADARQESTDNGVIAAGNDALNNGRPKIRFTAIPLDVEGSRFMRDWDFGDKVRAKYLNIEFDTIIRAVTVGINENGQETINARLDYES